MLLPQSKGFPILAHTAIMQDARAFLVDCQARRLAPSTVQRYGRELRLFRLWAEGQPVTAVQDITPDLLRRYLLHLAETRNPGGQHIAYRVLKTFLRWYEREHEPPDWKNPIAKVQAPKLPQDPLPPVPLADLRAMLATCERRTFAGDRDRAALLCLLDSGCRAGEFLALDIADVDLAGGSGDGGAAGAWRAGAGGARVGLGQGCGRGQAGDRGARAAGAAVG